MGTTITEFTFTENEAALIEEAVRRAAAMPGNTGITRETIAAAVRAEAARGTRHMFGLVKVGARAGRIA